MASLKRRRQSLAEAPYRPSHNSTKLQTTTRRSSLRSTVSTKSANTVSDDGDINEPSQNFHKTIASLKSAAESLTVRVLEETADEQARVIQAMRLTISTKDLRIQKLNRKIGRRDKSLEKLRKRMERSETAFSKLNWSNVEAMDVGTSQDEMMKILRDKRPTSTDGLCTKCGENCSRLVRDNKQLRDRLHEVDGLCMRLRTECSKMENKIRGLEKDLDRIRGKH
ncbi:6676268f-945f-45e3-a6b1-b993af8acc42 [Sclerotinia trifoliorum]|uniref:6676268f-945f-45e3-a6b1-b993af8acc42 n=1 Tax=Sclerotinia trifoliorum TaxID=28548 RepID=A0A8H2VKR6_9HELO|nr:6676268f-945f-45e3-a6b1-b993af8acc42 [Sclerotinia trifoliorum]